VWNEKRRGTYGDVRVTRASLGVGGSENGVDKHKGTDNLRTESSAFGVARADGVGTAAEGVVGVLHEGLHQADAADGTKALCYNVENRTDQRDLARQE